MKTKLFFSFLERIALVALIVAVAVCLLAVQYIQAADTELRQAINQGGLSVSIVDSGYASVASPSIGFADHTYSFECGSTAATLGSDSEAIYVQNPGVADNGWTLSIAPTGGTTTVWDSATSTASFDFNDINDSGCTDGDSDGVAGSLTIDPSAATLAIGNCASCNTDDITLGSESAFNGAATSSITLLTATASSSDIGDWTLKGVGLTQVIPSEQEAYDDYEIDMTMSIISA